MDFGAIVGIGGAIFGQVAHIVKKRTEEMKEEGITEIDIFKRWVFKRPFNTIGSVLGGLAVSQLAVTPGADWMTQLIQGFISGFAANSAINRPGEGK